MRHLHFSWVADAAIGKAPPDELFSVTTSDVWVSDGGNRSFSVPKVLQDIDVMRKRSKALLVLIAL